MSTKIIEAAEISREWVMISQRCCTNSLVKKNIAIPPGMPSRIVAVFASPAHIATHEDQFD